MDLHYVKRPKNAFLLFADDMRQKLKHTYQDVHSKRIGYEWSRLSTEVKDYYYRQARKLDAEHKRKYPGYVYNPQLRRNLKRLQENLKHRAAVEPHIYPLAALKEYEKLKSFYQSGGKKFESDCNRKIYSEKRQSPRDGGRLNTINRLHADHNGTTLQEKVNTEMIRNGKKWCCGGSEDEANSNKQTDRIETSTKSSTDDTDEPCMINSWSCGGGGRADVIDNLLTNQNGNSDQSDDDDEEKLRITKVWSCGVEDTENSSELANQQDSIELQNDDENRLNAAVTCHGSGDTGTDRNKLHKDQRKIVLRDNDDDGRPCAEEEVEGTDIDKLYINQTETGELRNSEDERLYSAHIATIVNGETESDIAKLRKHALKQYEFMKASYQYDSKDTPRMSGMIYKIHADEKLYIDKADFSRVNENYKGRFIQRTDLFRTHQRKIKELKKKQLYKEKLSVKTAPAPNVNSSSNSSNRRQHQKQFARRDKFTEIAAPGSTSQSSAMVIYPNVSPSIPQFQQPLFPERSSASCYQSYPLICPGVPSIINQGFYNPVSSPNQQYVLMPVNVLQALQVDKANISMSIPVSSQHIERPLHNDLNNRMPTQNKVLQQCGKHMNNDPKIRTILNSKLYQQEQMEATIARNTHQEKFEGLPKFTGNLATQPCSEVKTDIEAMRCASRRKRRRKQSMKDIVYSSTSDESILVSSGAFRGDDKMSETEYQYGSFSVKEEETMKLPTITVEPRQIIS